MLPGTILRAGSARTAFSRGLKTAAVAEQAYPVPLDQHVRARVSPQVRHPGREHGLIPTHMQARIAQIDAEKGAVSPFLVDTFRRQHNYLRISLTERCNLRCMRAHFCSCVMPTPC